MYFYVFELSKEGAEEGPNVSVGETKSPNNASENPDVEVMVEALKSLCNILLHNHTAQVPLFLLLCLVSLTRGFSQSHRTGPSLSVPLFGLFNPWLQSKHPFKQHS